METNLKSNRKQNKKGLTSKINAWLERMAKANEQQFGHQRMDCCQLKKF